MLPFRVDRREQHRTLQQNAAKLYLRHFPLATKLPSEPKLTKSNRQIPDRSSNRLSGRDFANVSAQNLGRLTPKNEVFFAKWAPTSNRQWPTNRSYRKQTTKPFLTGARTHISDLQKLPKTMPRFTREFQRRILPSGLHHARIFYRGFQSGDWLGGLDSNQDKQIQNLLYCQLYDLPTRRRAKKRGRRHDPELLYRAKASSSTVHAPPPTRGSTANYPAPLGPASCRERETAARASECAARKSSPTTPQTQTHRAPAATTPSATPAGRASQRIPWRLPSPSELAARSRHRQQRPSMTRAPQPAEPTVPSCVNINPAAPTDANSGCSDSSAADGETRRRRFVRIDDVDRKSAQLDAMAARGDAIAELVIVAEIIGQRFKPADFSQMLSWW